MSKPTQLPLVVAHRTALIPVRDVIPIDSVDHLDELRHVGRTIADHTVDLDHLNGFVDRQSPEQ